MTTVKTDPAEGAADPLEKALAEATASEPPRAWPTDPFERALAAEPRLRPIDAMVRTLCAVAPTDKPFCGSCIWEMILKPLVSPWLGWERGVRRELAPELPPDSWKPIDMSLVLDDLADRKAQPISDTERWLRDGDAWDVVTGRWLALLDAADPAEGCAVPQLPRSAR